MEKPVAPVVQLKIQKKPALKPSSFSSSLDNQIVSPPGSLFGKLRKEGDGFDDAGTFFKYDYHPEEKLAMSVTLDF